MGVQNSYTMEASMGGTKLGSRTSTHFSAQDYEQIGKAFCETLLDFSDEDPGKVSLAFDSFLIFKIFTRIYLVTFFSVFSGLIFGKLIWHCLIDYCEKYFLTFWFCFCLQDDTIDCECRRGLEIKFWFGL